MNKKGGKDETISQTPTDDGLSYTRVHHPHLREIIKKDLLWSKGQKSLTSKGVIKTKEGKDRGFESFTCLPPFPPN